MTDIEKKALALLNEVRVEYPLISSEVASNLALCRAIEQHEAFRQEVSDAAMEYDKQYSPMGWTGFKCFIIAKPDPLAEAMTEVFSDSGVWEPCNTADADALRKAIQARGGKIVWED